MRNWLRRLSLLQYSAPMLGNRCLVVHKTWPNGTLLSFLELANMITQSQEVEK